MPVKRRSSSKVATTVNKSPSAGIKVTKYSKPLEIKKVTETPTKTRRFATTRPDEPKISLEEYVSDFKIRMQINNYEVMEFLEDCKKWYNTSSPYVVKAFNFVKDKVQEFSATPVEKKEEDKPAE